MKKRLLTIIVLLFAIVIGWEQYTGVFGQGNKRQASSNSRILTTFSNVACSNEASRNTCASFFGYYSVAWFGAFGDGTTDSTRALQNGINYAQSYGFPLYITGGVGSIYRSDQLTYAYQSNPAALTSVICQPGTVISKLSADGDPLIQIGDAEQDGYLGPIKELFSGCDLRGYSGDTPNVVVSYDLAETHIGNVTLSGATGAGWKSYGGVSNVWDFPLAQNNGVGIEFTSFVRATGGVPNQNILNQPRLINNVVWGLYFENGQGLYVNQLHVEGNGNGNNFAGGVYCSPAPTLQGCIVSGGWFELNKGRQSILLNGGNNTVRDVHFNNSPSVMYDAYISNGGSFQFSNWRCGARATNIEDAGSSGPNSLANMTGCPNWNYDPATTRVDGLPNSNSNYSLGIISSGQIALDVNKGPFQSLINNGAFLLVPPSKVGMINLEVHNGPLAGPINTSQFSQVSGTYMTTNNGGYLFRATKTADYSLLEIIKLRP